jgi:hypothetical protein
MIGLVKGFWTVIGLVQPTYGITTRYQEDHSWFVQYILVLGLVKERRPRMNRNIHYGRPIPEKFRQRILSVNKLSSLI